MTTLSAGALMDGHDIFSNPLLIINGYPFSFTLLLILGCHEFGHYYYARKHNVDATLPYFIPVPPPITIIGTFGAFIKMRGMIPNRRALLEIGAAGPIAGFIIAVPMLFVGLNLSTIVDLQTVDGGFMLGDSIILKMATDFVFPNLPENADILLHPIAFAGWIGLFVTMLNLIPIGQLDGGHIAYALLGKNHLKLAQAMFVALILMGIFLSMNWLIWAILILLLMRSVQHPPIFGIELPLGKHEKIIGWICLIIFILCFVPTPFG
ncbi:MAG: site-2 protease family protein [Candidatus Marinimicrobia bacterium]|nr:site-2 protease family protein [Candidatus Neomarinimicrobiota bacterium]MBL7110003.1 site-2 protease family protein [Candidatus Neomarinimicrobiota bacterium]